MKENMEQKVHYNKILIIEPHPDDGALSMGGILSELCERGDDLVSVVVFSEIQQESKDIRKKESDTVWKEDLSGDVYYLDLPDENFHKTQGDKLVINNASKSVFLRCLKGLEELISRLNPDIIYFPIGIGGHFHHVMVNMCFDIIYSKHTAKQFYFYEDYPYSDFSRITYAKYVFRLWKRYNIKEEYRLIDKYIEMKKCLISRYKSQAEKENNNVEMLIEEYGKAISCEGIMKGYGLNSEKPYERVWKVI